MTDALITASKRRVDDVVSASMYSERRRVMDVYNTNDAAVLLREIAEALGTDWLLSQAVRDD